ncbi:alpha/beta hydrolase [Pseudonocardia xishanensis]|uniref:Alpha/beta hydrolase fold-3 domain-containing protein n=1 Tax=Pseudonocardia xishanensis TaxID=630995 RepID=A0ABP8RUA9_9PSEU
MSLDEATRAAVDAARAPGVPTLRDLGVDRARKVVAGMARGFRGPAPAERREVSIGGSGRGVLLVPAEPVTALVVHFHGGGWTLGAPEQHEAFGAALATAAGAAVLLPGYRLAPEHPFPAAIEDAWAAVRWAADRVIELAGSNVPLIVSGDSAGGNLAAVVARRARDGGGPTIAHQLLAYPALDPAGTTPSYLDPDNQLIFDADLLRWFWAQYAAGADRADPDLVPLRAELGGLPPATVLLAEHDVLSDEGRAYAAALAAAGVPSRVHTVAGQAHGFLTMVGALPGAVEGVALLADAVRVGVPR